MKKRIFRTCRRKGSQQVNLSELPVGTEFWMCKGEWFGSIVKRGDMKCVSNGKGVFPLDKHRNSLYDVKIYCEDKDSFDAQIMYNADS